MNAVDILESAAATLRERGQTYDPNAGQERSIPAVVEAFNAATGNTMTEQEGWLFMVILKAVRLSTSQFTHQDSALDTCSYTALLAESVHKKGDK